MMIAENATLSAHGFICEDGPELPKEDGQGAAQEGGETLEGMYAPGCGWLEQARIRGSVGAGIGAGPVGEYPGGPGRESSIQSAQKRIPTPVPRTMTKKK
jgi:hypothetical protein